MMAAAPRTAETGQSIFELEPCDVTSAGSERMQTQGGTFNERVRQTFCFFPKGVGSTRSAVLGTDHRGAEAESGIW